MAVASTAADAGPFDAFPLYNEREDKALVERVLKAAETAGLRVYYQVGESFADVETRYLEEATYVIVVIGKAGWGFRQVALLGMAVTLRKRIVPVVVDDPPEEVFKGADGFLRAHPYIEMRGNSEEAAQSLRAALRREMRSAPPPRPTERSDFRVIINTLVDGSDAERAATIRDLNRIDEPSRMPLAEQLRSEIRVYSPEAERGFAEAPRDPALLPAIRSWLLRALIQLGTGEEENQALVLRHLDPNYEPNRNVRFWTLAGIIETGSHLLYKALAQAPGDPALEVSEMALAAFNLSDELIARFRIELYSPDFQTAWHVLRLLRVVPIPELAPDVIAQFGRRPNAKDRDASLTYDALFALANPKMAQAAVGPVMDGIGLENLMRFVIDEARYSNEIAVRQFSYMLTMFDREQVSARLDDFSTMPANLGVVARIRSFMSEIGRSGEPQGIVISGASPDTIDIANDDMDIERDVQTLAATIASKGLSPPLAIGLFGPWGSGKSFFMKSLQAAVDRFAGSGRDAYCEKVVPIWFNAWHYHDANLWASLVSHIFEELSLHVSPQSPEADSLAKLRKDLASTQTDLKAAQAEKERATQTVEDVGKQLEAARIEREAKETQLRDLKASDFAQLWQGDANKAVHDDMTKALADVGAPEALQSVEDLNESIRESLSAGGRFIALLTQLADKKNRTAAILCIAALLVLPAATAALTYLVNQNYAQLSAILAEIATLAAAGATMLRKAIDGAKSGFKRLSEAKAVVDKLLAEKRKTPSAAEKKLEDEIAQARAQEMAATARFTAASTLAAQLEERIAEIENSRTLSYFLSDRTRSDDYRRHLGLISLIRKDFDTLVKRLKSAPAPGHQKVDRIILYIDDLDRCPSKMVVDVLQAVHLLLAYELFVVVVSVDLRWLLRSLEARYSHLRRSADGDAAATAPQDYLEKIFQIPYAVRRMRENGFSRLMERMLGVGPASKPEPVADVSPKSVTQPPPVRPDTDAGPLLPVTNTAMLQAGTSSAAEKPAAPRPRSEPAEEALVIKSFELGFAKQLHPFISTPRGAKRFANLYRLLKASVDKASLPAFEGSAQIPGEFQLAMTLLAVLVGRSEEAAELFPRFRDAAVEKDAAPWTRAGDGETEDAKRVREELSAIASAPSFPRNAEALESWIERVSRYSFNAALKAADQPGA
ncbi:MAG TPA: P-loop NTPase fold protein [Rhizomicrobium sp.]|nr:P-loop NTPase fold protein [Rhizomicrobium sp.]